MFSLSKWYLDCVTDAGDTSIAYTGEVVWGKIRLHYTNLLESADETRVSERHSLRKQRQPEIKDGVLSWQADTIGTRGEWKLESGGRSETEIRETILRSELGSIEWHCLAPKATTQLGKRSGFGYAEHLTMNIPPWKLLLKRLRWGRFIGDSHWVVWIDWQGEYSRRIVYADGAALNATVMEDDRMELSNGARLSMDRSFVLRDGPLGTTALSRIPGIQKMFPARLLQTQECKWRSRACLQLPGRLPVEGWAIHERVEWPK